MVEFQRKDFYSYEDFLEIMRLLRAPVGCPWDREQTHGSIRRNFLEETYEVLDAIDHDDAHGMCEELGDVLMQVASTPRSRPSGAASPWPTWSTAWPKSWCTATPTCSGMFRRTPPSRS